MTDKAISPLRRRMIEDMTVRGFTACYNRVVRWREAGVWDRVLAAAVTVSIEREGLGQLERASHLLAAFRTKLELVGGSYYRWHYWDAFEDVVAT